MPLLCIFFAESGLSCVTLNDLFFKKEETKAKKSFDNSRLFYRRLA